MYGGLRRTLAGLLAVAASALTSQAPEFAQQYAQRLGGAVNELRPIVENFDRDAQRSELTRTEALELYAKSHAEFLRDRGISMQEVIARYDRLQKERDTLVQLPSLLRPAYVLYSADLTLAADTREEFVPAVPLSLAGIVYAAMGFFLVLLIRASSGLLARMRARATTDL